MRPTAQQWEQIRARDGSHQDFVYAVRTTGVFCRPGCPSPVPDLDSVECFERAELAQGAGYRPCRRCRPTRLPRVGGSRPEVDRQLARAVVAARAMLMAGGPRPLAELGDLVGTSPRQVSRDCVTTLGVSPRAFGAAVRAGRARELLSGAPGVTEAIYAAGYGSARGFYEEVGPTLGMTALEYARAGRGQVLRWTRLESPIGVVLAAAGDLGLAAVRLGEAAGQPGTGVPPALRAEFPHATWESADRELAGVARALRSLASGQVACIELPTDVRATAFQARVWRALRRIPAGQTRTYAQVAEEMGSPGAARAVAGACAANPVALVIPCHRVVRSDGTTGGYRWGLSIKQALLAAESGGSSASADLGGTPWDAALRSA